MQRFDEEEETEFTERHVWKTEDYEIVFNYRDLCVRAPIVTAEGKLPSWATGRSRRIAQHDVTTRIAAWGIPCHMPSGAGTRYALPKELAKGLGYPMINWADEEQDAVSPFLSHQLSTLWCLDQLLPLRNLSALLQQKELTEG